MTTNDDDDPIGYWVLAMPLAVAGFACCVYAAGNEGRTFLIQQDAALLVLAVAAWARFRRLDNLVKRRR